MIRNYYLKTVFLLTALFVMLATVDLQGQQRSNLKGNVSSTDDGPIIGATVMIKGTSIGTVTNVDGDFSLNAPSDASIIVSYLGYKTVEIAVNGRTSIAVVLIEDDIMIDEAIVIGYGTMKKSDLTGAVASVDMKELNRRTTTNPAEALQGQISGVNVLKAGGNAGAGVSIKIRGIKSFGNNNPLYIIDGFPGDIDNVNPHDIASMEVLKDAAAAAIYGSVAANGVVIITTKNGKKGELIIDFNSYISVTEVANTVELLNASEYQQVHKQMYDNYNAHTNKPEALPGYISKDYGNTDTDWQDEVMRSGLSQNYMISLRGGSDVAQFAVSYNHADEKGIFLGNDFVQDNARIKLNVTKSIFDIDANLGFKYSKSQQPKYQLKEVYMLNPLMPVLDPSRDSGYSLTDFDGIPNNRNVMADNHYRTGGTENYYTTANVGVRANFTDWLNFRTSFSYLGEHRREKSHSPAFTADVKSPTDYPSYQETTGYWEEKVFDNVLTFNKEYGKHSINAMVGTSITTTGYSWNEISAEGKTDSYSVVDGKIVITPGPGGFLDPYFQTIGAGTGGLYDGSGSMWQYNRASFFGRINYNYGSRYLFQATVRRDGSSKFGSDSRWGTFPSVALGWRVSKEEFFPKDMFLDELKVRASWGRLGNENKLGYYDFQALITSQNWLYQAYVQGEQNPWTGSIARGLENRSLQWETTDSKNIGIDFGFGNSTITGSVNYYHNATRDLLITQALPPSAGLTNPVLNVGEIKNSGFEFDAKWNHSVKDFNFNVGLNFTTTKNEVVALSSESQSLMGYGLQFGDDHFPTRTTVGNPIGSFYLYRTDGIFQSTEEVQAHSKDGKLLQENAQAGDIRFKDLNDDGKIDEDDKENCGSGIPKLEVNVNFAADYKGFDMSFVIGSGWGHKLYNGTRYFYEGMNTGSNFLTSTLDAWTPENTNTSVPRAVLKDPNRNTRESDRFLEDGDFIRLRQVQLGYALPSSLLKKTGLSKLRIYVSGENLFTFTKYDGIDPEFGVSGAYSSEFNSPLNTGVDLFVYPFTSSYTVGVQITF